MFTKRLLIIISLVLVYMLTLTQAGYALRPEKPDAGEIRRAAEEEGDKLASGQTLSPDDIKNRLATTPMTGVLVTTGEHIMNNFSPGENIIVTEEPLLNAIDDGYLLAIAVNDGSAEAIEDILSRFSQSGRELLERELELGNVFFTVIGNPDILTALQTFVEEEAMLLNRTLDKLDDAATIAAAIASGV